MFLYNDIFCFLVDSYLAPRKVEKRRGLKKVGLLKPNKKGLAGGSFLKFFAFLEKIGWGGGSFLSFLIFTIS